MEKTLGQIAYEAYCESCGKIPEYLTTEEETHWERAGRAACQVGGNYVADNEVRPTEITFVNGRKVKVMPENWDEEIYLMIE